MPTFPSDRESKTHTTLPDIFRTIRGDNLGIGPQSRIRDAGTKENKAQWGRGIEPQIAPASYPRIVLRDALGYELDTYTTLQEAIYRAKWNVKQSGQAKTPIEWRLPKAPPPARPDLTRTCPPVKHPVSETEADRQRKKQPYTNVLEFDVDDVGFVKESLQCLPYVPSLSFLRQEFLCGPKMYFQIVGTMLLHERFLSLTEKRNAVYNFPGFCTGCTRMGLCYGCEKSSEPHYHEDKPVKTGGGFTYFKKDRPEREIKGKNPAHWRINHPDHALKQLMEEYAGVDLEGAVPEEVKKHLDQYGGHREHKISHIPDFATEMNQFNRTNGDIEPFLPEIVNPADIEGHHGNNNLDGHHGNNNLSDLASGNLRSRSYGNIQDEESDIEKYEMMRDQGQGDGSQSQQIESNYSYQDSQGGHGNKRRSRSEEAKSRKDVINIAVGKRGSSNDGGDRLPNIKKEDSDQIDEDSSEEDRDEGKSRGRSSKRKGNLYKPPPAFKLKKSPSRRIESKSPFSSERKYNLPLGSGFQVKKSDKAPTKFKDFRNVDVSWKEPKKFELKDSSAKTTKFWSGPRKNKDDSNNRKHRRRSPGAGRGRSRHNQQQLGSTTPRSITPDSGLDSELMTDSTIKSELEPLKEEPIIPTPSPSPPPPQEPAPKPVTQEMDQPPKTPPKRKEIVKKEKKEKPRPPKPPTPVHEPTPSPSPTHEEPPVTSREISFVFEKEPSGIELPPIEIPALPDMPTPQVAPKQKVKKELKLIEVTPQLPEPKKKLPPPPKVGPKIRPYTLRKSKVAEAPVTPQELQQLSDPLDFLAKYCIINPDRLPFYERIFNGAVSVQSPRYIRNDVPAPGQMVQLPPAVLSEHELNMLRDLTVLNHAQTPRREGMSAPEQYLEKLNYTVELIKSKQSTIQDHMAKLQGEKIHILAQLAKEMDRDISRVDYKVKGKAKKKKKKKKVDVVDYDKMGAMSMNAKDFKPTKASDITAEVIVSRMNDKMMKKAKKDPIVKTLSLEISRDIEKMKHYDQRIAQIEDEKDLVGLYCMDYYFSEQGATSRPHEFRRQQSRLYQKLHPDPDVEMNIEEVEMSLQQINNKLLTEKEFQYIYFILDLPKREKINFRLFSIIAALSEKVTQMDPMVRKLINKNDYNALDVKMEKSKELFDLLQDADLMPLGNAPSDNLAVELTAGGLTPEHTNYVLSKFDREGRGHCDFMDFVTYVPLFLQIHNRIISDPFNDSLDV